MAINCRRFSFLLVLLVLSGIAFVPLVSAGETEAASAIATTKQQMLVCYQASKKAEAAGANITSLADVLNDAGALLSDAELAYSYGDFDTAQRLAIQSGSGLVGFVSEANELHDEAVAAARYDFYILLGSVFGTVAVVLVGVAVWFLGKRRFFVHGESEIGWREDG